MGEKFECDHSGFSRFIIYRTGTLMKNVIIILVIAAVSLFSACVDSDQTIPIGLETEIVAAENDVLPFNAYHPRIFDSILLLEKNRHYQGKAFALFDTVYTSILDDLDPVAAIKIMKHGNFSVIEINESNPRELLLKRHNHFIYRVVVPEEIKKQTIVIDYVNKDSAKVTKYFNDHRISKILR